MTIIKSDISGDSGIDSNNGNDNESDFESGTNNNIDIGNDKLTMIVIVNQKPESNYVVDLQARTVIGWGTSVKKAVEQ